MSNNIDKKIIYFLIFIIALNSFLAYYPHFSNPFPLLADEYNHISLGRYIIEEHKFPDINPNLINEPNRLNLESGFHFVIAFVILITKIFSSNFIFLYKYLIISFMIINSLMLFYLTKLWFKNNYVSLISVFLFGLIKSTNDFLAHNYLIPLTLGITFLFLNLIFFTKLIEEPNKKSLIYLLISLILIAIIYPPALTFFILLIFVYVLSMEHNINEIFKISKSRFFGYFIILSSIIIILGIFIFSKLNLINYLIFTQEFTSIRSNLSPIFFFGVIPFSFALIGLLKSIKLKQKIIFYWFLFCIIQIYLFYIFGFTILVPFIRLFLFYLISLSILGAIGIISVYNYFTRIKLNYKLILIIIISILLLTQIYFVYNHTKNLNDNLVEILDKKEYESLKFIEKNYKKNQIVIADPITSIAVYPIIGNKVLGTINANIGGGYVKEINEFFLGNCDKKQEIINQIIEKYPDYSILALSEKEISCSFLKQAYSTKPFVYEYEI